MTEIERQFIAQLYSKCSEKLFIYAFSRLKDRNKAEDLVIETFVSAVKKAPDLLTHENPCGWLMTALKLHIKMHMRKTARAPQMVPYDTVTEYYTPQATDLEDTEDGLLRKAGLTDIERQECRMYFFEDLPHDRVAAELGITVSASRKRRERLRKKLKRRWGKIF